MDTKIDLHRFDAQIADIEQHWKERPPQKGGILLYGSSTMANWRAENWCYDQLAPFPVANAGFGGSTAEEALYYYHRLVVPVQPSVMVYYEGANDLDKGYSIEDIIATTHRLFEWARQDFPGIRFVIIPMKLSPGLRIEHAVGKLCNESFSAYAEKHADTSMIDVSTLIYSQDGELRTDIYVDDLLHHNRQGYEELSALVKPVLAKLYKNPGV